MARFLSKVEYKDIPSSFTAHPVTGDLATTKDENAIKQSIRSLIKTRPKERVFRPDIGCNVEDYLFEQMNDVTSNRIRNIIETTLNTLEPRVDLGNITVTPNPDNNEYIITMTYFINGLAEEQYFQFYLSRES